MANFRYRARDAQGALVQGEVAALDAAAAADSLVGRGLIPVELAAPDAVAWGRRAGRHDRQISDEERMFFSRQMHTLLKAGVPILQALSGLRDSATNPVFAQILDGLRDSLDRGQELSGALADSSAFNEFYVQMVRIGEATGRMDTIFLTLFSHLRFEKEMRARVKSALRYPVFVVVAIVAALGVLNWLVIPAFAGVFRSFRAELPLMTRVLIGVSDFFTHYGWLILLLALLGTLGARAWLATPAGRLIWDRRKLELPIAGSTIRKATLARFARSFSLALSSDLPAIQAFSVVSRVVDNAFLGARIDGMRQGVERGESILQVASQAQVFTPVVLQMIAVGETSGSIDSLLMDVAELYEREVDYEIETLSARIEPLLIVALGAIVLVMALGIFLPIWDLSSAMLRRG